MTRTTWRPYPRTFVSPVRTRGERLTEAERELFARKSKELRARGWKLEDIALHLSISKTTAHRLIRGEA